LDEQKILELATLIKWRSGEPLSYFDMERLIGIIRERPLSMSSPTPDDLANMKSALLSTLQEKFFQEQ
jgi:hypothetical protein